MNKEILKFCVEKGFLVDNDLLEVFNETSDVESIKLIIERVKTYTRQNVLTRNLFEKNKEQVNKFFLDLPEEKKIGLERLRIKLGLSIEISTYFCYKYVVDVARLFVTASLFFGTFCPIGAHALVHVFNSAHAHSHEDGTVPRGRS
mgnify:CR=1 FL=1